MDSPKIQWQAVGKFSPPWWRSITSRVHLSSRMFRDGFHALAVLSSGEIVGAVAGAIAMLAPGAKDFQATHRITRGTRPLHLTVAPSDEIFWGEYFDNPQREAVNVYRSRDKGRSWSVAYTFPKGSIRHIHNIVYDSWRSCLWVLTGDDGAECRVLRANSDFSRIETVLAGNQQARAVAAVPMEDGLYFSSDTPFEQNYIYRIDRNNTLSRLATISSSSIYGCRVGDIQFFSTMVEPSQVNADQHVRIYGGARGENWNSVLAWKKDAWPMRFFQYGNAFLPDGDNTSDLLAISTIAVAGADLQTSLWKISRGDSN